MSDRSFDPEALLHVGRIWKPHGVRGELKVIPESIPPEHLLGLPAVVLGASPEKGERYEVTSARMQHMKRGPLVLLQLVDIDGRDEAEGLRRLKVYATREDLPDPDEGEHFVRDLVGAEVVDPDGAALGTLTGVEETPGHDLFVIGQPDGREALVPAVEAFVRSIDVDHQRIVIAPIEGLLD